MLSGGDPAVLFEGSDHNRVVRTSLRGGIAIRVGDAIYVLDGSDADTVVDSDIDGGGAGRMLVRDSMRNRVKRSTAYGYAGAIHLHDANRTLVIDNELNGGQGCALCVRGDRNTIRGNRGGSGNGGIEIDGDRNLVLRNRAVGGFFNPNAISVHSGNRNVIRDNEAEGGFASAVIHVAAAANRTSLVRNSASGGSDVFEPTSGDGIKVDAPETLIRSNTANDNDALGINAIEGVIDGGDNHASGNGDPRQCVEVVCTP